MNSNVHHSVRFRVRAGFSIIEVLLAALIMSFLLVSALQLLGNLGHSRYAAFQESTGERFVLDTIGEIMLTSYRDKDTPANFGPETGESTRADFDDVDDYNGWTGPPQDKAGNIYDDIDFLTGQVSVSYASSADLGTKVADDEGFKAVRIKVLHDGRVILDRRFVLPDVDDMQ